MALLEVNNIDTYYGKSHILSDVSLKIPESGFVTLIGRNGAGKTTTIESIMGMVLPQDGNIVFRGQDITDAEPNETSMAGISIIPEHRRIFADLTVQQNLRLGHLGHDEELSDVGARLDDVYKYFPRLEERKKQRSGTLSGGEQQMLAVGRALLSDPDLLLIDEPTEGLMPSLVDKLRDILVDINNDGIALLLVEQNARLALEISDYGYVIDEGKIRAEGNSDELAVDDDIKKQYLMV
jgi:branched-chain amino acid transport system ATP-binding protein